VNREHFRAFLWLRWRLRVNQFRKAGAVNAVFFAIFMALAGVAAVGLFVAGVLVGLFALPHASPMVRLLVWDGLVIAFLFCWMIGLLTEVQRAEGLALDKFLHLPVSVSGAFVINYLSSLFSITLMAFVPGMVGLALGQLFSEGPAMLLAFPLLAAFVFALTAITYQFQGWLASLMSNPRRRRTVIVIVTGAVILLAQAPNLINVFRPWEKPAQQFQWKIDQETENNRQLSAKEVSYEQYTKRQQEINEEYQRRHEETNRQVGEQVDRTSRLLNTVLPPGWLPLGAAGLADGQMLAAVLGTLAFGLIGTASLWRAYRTTVRLYTGQFATGERRATTPAEAAAEAAADADLTRVRFLEWRLPWVSEHASAVAVAAFRSLLRAPEAKMSLLAPIIMVVVFGGIAASGGGNPPAVLRPLLAFGAAAGVLLIGGAQLIGNQFGYDRAGFRAYVLSPVPRREILLGKNLAVAPLAVGMGTVLLLLVGIVFPMRIDYYPAALAQLVSAYVIFCALANGLSILAPMPMKAGTLQAAEIKLVPVVLQMVFLMILPLVLVPVLVPYGLETLLDQLDVVHGLPISLVLSLGVLGLVVYLYGKLLTVEGAWLSAREQKILEVVTSKAE
jgi:ABC-2 type transport system permease protein